MGKFIITFGSSMLPTFRGNPMNVMLVIEAETENEARAIIRTTSVENNFCTSYPYTEERVKDFENYGMSEYSLSDLNLVPEEKS